MMQRMILAAHQPNYLPWLGYFYKIAKSDVFVILDDVQYARRSYQNRTRIKGPSGPLWLTQPVLQAGRYHQSTLDVVFDDDHDWRRKHLQALLLYYAKSPFAGAVMELCREWLAAPGMRLSDVNTQIIRGIARFLGLRAEMVLSSTLGVALTKGDRIAEICRRLGARTYLSGQGARSYQSDTQFSECGVQLTYSDFAAREYPQLWGEFCPGLSIVDVLFNLGPEATKAMLSHGDPRVE